MARNLTRRQFLQAAAGLVGAAFVAGCDAGSTGQPATPIPPPTATAAAPALAPANLVRFAWWTDVGNPTPFQVSTTGPGGAVLISLIFDTLTWKDGQGIIPCPPSRLLRWRTRR